MSFQPILSAKEQKKEIRIPDVQLGIEPSKSKFLVSIIMSAAVDEKILEGFRYAVAFEGTGEDTGYIRISRGSATEPGAMKIIRRNTKSKNVRLYLPSLLAYMPKAKVETSECKVVELCSEFITFKVPDACIVSEETSSPNKTNETKAENSAPSAPVKKGGYGFQANKKSKQHIARTPPTPRGNIRTGADVLRERVINVLGQDITGAEGAIRPIEYLRRKGITLVRQPDTSNQWRISGGELTSKDSPPMIINTDKLVDIINSFRRKVGVPAIGAVHLIDE